MRHIFISRQRDDSVFANRMTSKLTEDGFTTWTDDDIDAGIEWQPEIDTAIRNAIALVVIMTPEARASEYIAYEWAFARGAGITVIPVVLRDTELHPRLKAVHHLDFTSERFQPWDRLIRAARTAADSVNPRITLPNDTPGVVRNAVSALDSPNSDERIGALETIMTAAPELAESILRWALNQRLPDLRAAAAKNMVGTNEPTALAALIETMRDRHAIVREAAAIGLAGSTDPAALHALIEALKDPDIRVRKAVANSLTTEHTRRAGADPRTIAAIQEILRDPDRSVRINAERVMRKLQRFDADESVD